MNIILRRNPAEVVRYPSLFHSPLSMIEELNELSGKFWEAWPEMTGGDIIPRTEMYEDNGNLVVKTEMPGINKEDVDISLEGDILTLKAEKNEEEDEAVTAKSLRCNQASARKYRTTYLLHSHWYDGSRSRGPRRLQPAPNRGLFVHEMP